MTSSIRGRRLNRLAVAATVAIGLALLTAGAQATSQGTDRTIYVSVVGSNGMPVIDPPIAPAELTVTEDGTAREISKIDKADEPVYFAVLYETTMCANQAVGGGAANNVKCESNNTEANATDYMLKVREALTEFVTVILTAAPSSKIMLMDFGTAAVVTREFTSSVGDLTPILARLVTTKAEPVLHEALSDVSARLAKVPSRRRVIVVVNREPTTDGSRVVAATVADDVRKSGASLWGLSVRYGTRNNGPRDVLLKGLATNSGGLRLTLGNSIQLADYLKSVAANSIVQYAVTIKRPADAPPAKVTQVKLARPGATPLTLQWSDKIR
jgi:hypothetical protein